MGEGTSFKMDFLSSGTVRTDPLMFSQTGECLSDHVHRFYGAASDRTMRPEVSYSDLRNAPGNTGNVEENKSLYWNPAIYKVVNQNGNKEYQIVDVWFASAYYLWRTGQATAFPKGRTNKAAKYGANVRCLVTYKRRGSCKKMKVSCDQFSLATGDTLRVQRGRNKQTFRGSAGPTLETTVKVMKV